MSLPLPTPKPVDGPPRQEETFHLFPKLPFEIRAQIIETAVLSALPRRSVKTLGTSPLTFRSDWTCTPCVATTQPGSLLPPDDWARIRQVSQEASKMVDRFLACKMSCSLDDPNYDYFSWWYRPDRAAATFFAEKQVRLPLPCMHPDNTIYYIRDSRVLVGNEDDAVWGWTLLNGVCSPHYAPPLLHMRWVRAALVELDFLYAIMKTMKRRKPGESGRLIPGLPNLSRMYAFEYSPSSSPCIIEGEVDETILEVDLPKPCSDEECDVVQALKQEGIEVILCKINPKHKYYQHQQHSFGRPFSYSLC